MNRLLPSSLRRLALAVALLALPVAARAAATDPALEVVQTAVKEALAVIYDQPANNQRLSDRVRPVLEKHFDAEYATRSAVGPGWKQFSPEQQSRTVELFTQLVIRTYADRFEPGARPQIAYGTPRTPAAKRREVPSTVTYEGQNYAIVYRLRESASGWQLYDVIIENVSMISNYRAQFDELFRKGGAKAVIDSLEQNLRQVTTPRQS